MTDVCTVNYIDHVGVAVKNIDTALAFFKKVFDVPDADIELMEDQGVRACLIEVGQTRLELLEPTGPESGVGRFIERRGEGLHHLAFNVTDISGKLQTLQTLGVDLIDQTPREGLSGTIAFVHPRSVFGILTELVESDPK
ncbi:MAG: methylmalonyl-CoA epimerase [SAR202 cluster bacterium]|uniref:Methylmalonyl-CoA epimerase n=1 Tax=hydrothermal vent metagenome TaxID=652676 RepID=A0A160V8X1_9ZZZZ|nr:methylmalonyl-CoA epimerase [Dehalococcoidia bacterium]MQF92749.1 methylmalonyl-CoA epimerase [SAR202 cluster bacterium]MCH2498717.1 methylmalonyl-CoA epimerase [Dehalococcoidia bacterium]MQG13036.1 methylmalonyl-CoA epimerase [SAR202 cluster bacterium]MQG41484.1 methylmalonyl-CoA epimerase [SAR202 cluster bacterium]